MTESRPRRPLTSYAIGGFMVLAAVAFWRNTPHLAPGAFNWAESGNTAAALAEGRGFSDPFVGGTGPTAWIPPVFVWVVCGAFLVAGVKTAAAAGLLLCLAVVGLAIAHTILLACIDFSATWARRVTSGVFLGFATLLPANPFEVMSEAWLNILLTTLLLWSVCEHRRAPRPRVTAVLVATALIAPLTNAGLALATGMILVILLVLERAPARPRGTWRGLIVALAATVLAVGAWTVRNAVALGHFVPLKSNLWFEVHLANVASADGLPRAETVMRQMPFFSTTEFARYAALGELRYVDSFRPSTVAALRADPWHFAANVARRAANALAFCRLEDGSRVTRMPFLPGDMLRLVRAGILLPLGGTNLATWTQIDTAPSTAQSQLKALQLDDFSAVWRDWAEKHAAYDQEHYGVRGLAMSFLMSGVPVLAFLGLALASRGALPPAAGWAALIMAAMLLPYILVNHTQRHQAPLVGLQAIMIGFCAEACIKRWRTTPRQTLP